MKNFNCAIFDLDGTLLDSTDVWNEIDVEFFSERGLVLPPDYAVTIAPMGFERAAIYTVEKYNLKETPSQVTAVWNEMAQRKFASSVFIKPYVKEYLEFLKNSGVKLCVATASHEELFVPALENNEILHLFDCITTLKEVKRGKGFPDIYLKAAEKINASPKESVVFEDIYEGIKGANDGGFYSVGVYDKNSTRDIEKIKSSCDRFIYSFSELM